MPDLDDHAQLKGAHPELVLFQDLLAERPGATWNDVLVRLLEPVYIYLLCQPHIAFPAAVSHIVRRCCSHLTVPRKHRHQNFLRHVAADASARRLRQLH